MPDTPPRTYGGWRQARGLGLFGLGLPATIGVLAAMIAALVAVSVTVAALAVVVPAALLVLAGVVVRWDGVSLAQAIWQRLRWTAATARGWTSFRGGMTAPHPHGWQLPGVLAATELVETPAGAGVVRNRRLGTLTATLRCAAQSIWLADPDDADAWVANWGSWLAGLGHQPTVRWIAVTVATAPDSGRQLADYLNRRLTPDAPPAALHLMRQLLDAAPHTTADVQTWVSITVDPARSPTRRRALPGQLADLDRLLPGLRDSLAGGGLTVLGPATAPQLAGIIRQAYDPAARDDITSLLDHQPDTAGAVLGWDNAGPVAATEHPDRYEHDGAASVSWAWHEAPRQAVTHHVLARLLAPGPHRKRVTILYRPLSAGQAATEVQRQVNAAQFRAAYRRARKLDPTARDLADHEQAAQAAREEAVGAGLGLLSLWVTTTVLTPAVLDHAVADIEARADASKLRLRRLWHSQATGFATTLPAGTCPPVLARTWPR